MEIRHIIDTERPIEEVVHAAVKAHQAVGGELTTDRNTIQIKNGIRGVTFGSFDNYTATITIERIEKSYHLTTKIVSFPNALFWFVAFLGLFTGGLLWIILLVASLFANPEPVYWQALKDTERYLT